MTPEPVPSTTEEQVLIYTTEERKHDMTMEQWIASANKGDTFIYFTGHLAFEREILRGKPAPTRELAQGLENADLAMYAAGFKKRNREWVRDENAEVLVALTQKRVTKNVFEYRATFLK